MGRWWFQGNENKFSTQSILKFLSNCIQYENLLISTILQGLLLLQILFIKLSQKTLNLPPYSFDQSRVFHFSQWCFNNSSLNMTKLNIFQLKHLTEKLPLHIQPITRQCHYSSNELSTIDLKDGKGHTTLLYSSILLLCYYRNNAILILFNKITNIVKY